MDIKDEIIAKLSKHKEVLKSKYPLKLIGLFGSVARGDSSEFSDVDILVEFSEPVGMEVVDLVMELETLLNKRVDLVTTKAIKPSMRPYIEKDLIYV
jgi:uncharacterized protein